MSRTIMTAVKQDAVSATQTMTYTNSLLKEVTLNEGASLLPKAQLDSAASSRELVSNALQQGLESLGDTMADKGVAPKFA
ncbi:hypothetical protein M408DRAFT_326694 [Serendipita vermifera MAFF 305830]|uniref:Uncharacterized protein n=1 Tax=Serendipita vermifera MAFF 305830 TaxID=933852 RepID=A0A0C3B885_SERVB|nr:hypothetical protein M408DRAFT_326694 [Serendipita vermifera MAFF 305830]